MKAKKSLATLSLWEPPLSVNVRKGNGIFIFIKMHQASKSENRSSSLLFGNRKMSLCVLGIARGLLTQIHYLDVSINLTGGRHSGDLNIAVTI